MMSVFVFICIKDFRVKMKAVIVKRTEKVFFKGLCPLSSCPPHILSTIPPSSPHLGKGDIVYHLVQLASGF